MRSIFKFPLRLPFIRKRETLDEFVKRTNKHRDKIWGHWSPLPEALYDLEVEKCPNISSILTYDRFVNMFFIKVRDNRYIARIESKDMLFILKVFRQQCYSV